MIDVKNVYKKFYNEEVLHDVSALFERGKTNLIIGRSGSGKTVLLKAIVGLFEADSGEIRYDGVDFIKLNNKGKKQIRKEIGMMFQGGALFDSYSVLENVMYPLDMFTNEPYSKKRERAIFCLERVNLKNTDHLYPAELSGGMKKRVAIARAIAMNPKYLFCDEPNSGLDPQTSILIDNLIWDITKEFNMTTIINSHDMNSVMEIGENVVFLYNGRKWWEGSNKEILESNNKELNDFIFASRFLNKLREG